MVNKNRITQTWYAGIVIVLILAATWLPPGRAPVARADKPPEATSPSVTPVPPKKREARPAALEAGQGGAQFTSPSADPTSLLAPLAASAAGDTLITCGALGSSEWTTQSIYLDIIRQCTLTAPQAGWAFISANGSLALQDLPYEAWFRIGIDSDIGDDEISRFVNVYDTNGGTDQSVALSVFKPISAGTHTFYFLGGRYYPDDPRLLNTVLVRDASLSVIFIPASDIDVSTCRGVWQNTTNNWWETISNSFVTIHECTLTAGEAGWAFIAADGSAGLYDADHKYDYEAQFSIAIDISTTGKIDTDRYVNIYADAAPGDGSDKSVALSVLKPVSAGAHTFYSLGRLSNGAGPAFAYDPTLTVIFIPAPASPLLTCGSSGDSNWPTTSSSFQVIRQCTLTVPEDGRAFLSADGSLAQLSGPYEAEFHLGIDDSTGGDVGTNRWVDIYNDGSPWTENTAALSSLRPVGAGTHTFYLLGRRSGGAGTVLVRDPTLSVIFEPVKSIYVPAISKGP